MALYDRGLGLVAVLDLGGDGIGVDPVGNTPAEFSEFIRRDAPLWREAVNAAGIKPE